MFAVRIAAVDYGWMRRRRRASQGFRLWHSLVRWKAADKGTIRFVPIDGTEGQKTSTSIHGGSFVLPAEAGPVVGEHRVEIEAPAAGDLAMDDEEALEQLAAAGRPVKVDFPVIPAVYNTRSTLKKTVTEGEDNVFTFELSSKPQR